MSLLATPGFSIETLEPVSTISLLAASMSTVKEGVPRSNNIETAFARTAFSEVARQQELSSFTPRHCFPNP